MNSQKEALASRRISQKYGLRGVDAITERAQRGKAFPLSFSAVNE